ncbi:unnamed protein product [Calypogeia fissa]
MATLKGHQFSLVKFAVSSTIGAAAVAAPSRGNGHRAGAGAGGVLCATKANSSHVSLLQSSGLRCSPPHFLLHRQETTVQKTFTLGVRAISTNEFKTGTNIELDGAPWKVLEFLHVKPGKGAAFVRTKLRNYVTGNTVDRTFRAGEQIPLADLQKDVKQFSYMDGDQFVFMDMETYEEVRLSKAEVGDRTKFLAEGMDCSVLTWNDKVIDIDLPVTVKLKVTQSDPGLKGDTAQGGSKLVTVETGAQVNVPLFVNQDDVIVIQTKDGSYMSRA